MPKTRKRSRQEVPGWFRRSVEIKTDLGIAIGNAMEDKGLTAREVANRLNDQANEGRGEYQRFSKLSVEKIRSANAFPSLRTIARLEEVLEAQLIEVPLKEYDGAENGDENV